MGMATSYFWTMVPVEMAWLHCVTIEMYIFTTNAQVDTSITKSVCY